MMTFLTHALILTTLTFLIFVINSVVSASLSLRLVLISGIVYFAIRNRLNKQPLKYFADAIFFSETIIFILTTTGGLISNFFFLTYFLLFSQALLLSFGASLGGTIGLILGFMAFNQVFDERAFYALISLPLIAPLAFFIGAEHKRNSSKPISSQENNEDIFLFLTLVIKNQLQNIGQLTENFKDLSEGSNIRKQVKRMEKNIDRYIEKL